MLGSLVDIEPFTFAHNTTYLGLLIAPYVLLGLHREGARRRGNALFWLLAFAVLFQSRHDVEHIARLAQFVALRGRNGTGGVFGQGPGATFPLFRSRCCTSPITRSPTFGAMRVPGSLPGGRGRNRLFR